jgi:RNA polymerase sigma factor (sigma-70 family)
VRLHRNLKAARRHGETDVLLRAWLLRVTGNVAHNSLRGRRRAESRDQVFGMEWLKNSGTELPDEELQRQAEIVKTRRALARLKEPLRNILLLRNEGLSYKEIAAALGIKEASVGTLLVRARREFIRVFGKA